MRLNDTSGTDSTTGNRILVGVIVDGVMYMYVPPRDPPENHTITIDNTWLEMPAEHDLYAWNAGPPAWPWPVPPRELGTRGLDAPEPETPPPKRIGAAPTALLPL